MILSYVTLAVALGLSTIAAWYSIAGLAAVFSAAVIPIMLMGGILELAKVVVTLWLHEYWSQCRTLMKTYLVPAVAILMLITSMGIFGFLSKAHSDQNLVSGDVQAKIAVYDEKIKVAKDNIDANRRALKQMDEAVDQVMGRSQDEKGADKAVAIRRAQAKERTRLLAEIAIEQKTITAISEERAPIAAEVRKVEAEVGPIKYIAAFIYGDSPDSNLLERAVRWVIILLVAVFDPLAIMMLLAATESIKWEKQRRQQKQALQEQEQEFQEALDLKRQVAQALDQEAELPVPTTQVEQPAYLDEGDKMFFKNLEPMPSNTETVAQPMVFADPGEHPQDSFEPVPEESYALLSDSVDKQDESELPYNEDHPAINEAIRQWKANNPQDTLKNQRSRLARGEISQLPWMQLVPQADNQPGHAGRSDFGIVFPSNAAKGDMFVRVDKLPNQLYKFNGLHWIEVDKNLTDSYTYDVAYLDHLIAAIGRGEYDLELLNDTEREQIATRLSSKTNT